jgi:hypothetical protein
MKCLNCEHISGEVDKTGFCRARCTLKTTPKKGKIIYWASTTLFPTEYGYERVEQELKRKKSAPKWCPLTKKIDE